MIYLDHNATTPVDQRVLEAMLPYLSSQFGNPSSLHRLGRIARSAIEQARHQVAGLVQTDAANIVFTSGGTEANALAINSTPTSQKLAISAIEHPSVYENAHTHHSPLVVLPVDRQGRLQFEAENWHQLAKGDWVSVMTANNETGVIQDMSQLAVLCQQKGLILHTDAVQAAGKIPIDFDQTGISLMTISSHKLYGPKACGALIRKPEIQLKPLFKGGNQENQLRPGTENIANIVGFGKACEIARLELEERTRHLLQLQSALESALRLIPETTIFSSSAPRINNTTQFAITDTLGEMLVMQFDKYDIAVSSGSACKEGDKEASPSLSAMQIPLEQNKAAIRVSLGKDNTLADIERFITILQTLLNRH